MRKINGVVGALLAALVVVSGCSGGESGNRPGTGGTGHGPGGGDAGGGGTAVGGGGAGGGPAVGGNAGGVPAGGNGGAGGTAGAGPAAGGNAGGGGSAGAGGAAGMHGSGGTAGTAPGLGGVGGGIHIIGPGMGGGAGQGTAGAAGAPPPVPGVLSIVAGQLGGGGNLDGVGTQARLGGIWGGAYDPDDNRVYVNDGSIRVVDVATGRVTHLEHAPGITDEVVYQRGALYLIDIIDWQLERISLADGAILATTPMTPARPIAQLSDLTWSPEGDALFWLSSDGALLHVETATGTISTTSIPGFPAGGFPGATAMVNATTILTFVTGANQSPNYIVSIDLPTATATIVATVPYGSYVMAIDPAGQFAELNSGVLMPIGSGVAPTFSLNGPLIRGPQDSVLICGGTSIKLWDRSSATPTVLAGLDAPTGSQSQGPGTSVVFPGGTTVLAAAGAHAYIPAVGAGVGLSVIDLTTTVVSPLTLPRPFSVAALWPAADGTLYVTERSDCSIWRIDPTGSMAEQLPSPVPSPCLSRPGGMPTNPANHNWIRSGMASLDGALFVASQGVSMLEQIDLSTGSSMPHYFYGQLSGSGLAYYDGMDGLAVGSDGLLYGVDGNYLYRFDRQRLTATVVGTASSSIAADKLGHVFTTDAYTVQRYDIATGEMRTVVGAAGSVGVVVGALPGSLNSPQGLAVTDDGDLLIGNIYEGVIVRAHFQ